MIFQAIAAICNNKGIGIQNKLPWNLPSDLQKFKKLTMGNGNNSIIMGRKTWESIKILPNRHHYILSSSLQVDFKKNNYEIKSFPDLNSLKIYLQNKNYDVNWVIGGSQIYKLFFENNLIQSVYITFIDKYFECDSFFPQIPKYFLKKEMRIVQKLLDGKTNIYHIIYEKINKGQKLLYKNKQPCFVKDIHFDDFPNIYITIYYNNKEVQTVPENLKHHNSNYL